MSEQQAVAEKDNAEAKPSAENSGAQEWDTVLDEFDAGVQTKENAESDKPKANELEEVTRYVKEIREREARKQVEDDIRAAVATVKDGLEVELSDRVVRGYLEQFASTDTRFMNAFQNRSANPSGWRKVLEAARRELASEFQVDRKTTEDREAVASAVRNASTSKRPDDDMPNFASMSDAEFARAKMDMLRKARRT